VQFSSMIDMLSKRAPSLVVYTLCIALLSVWVGAPIWAVTALAVVIGVLALLLFAARGGRRPARGASHARSWLAWEVAGQGTPPGSYLLAFFSFLAVFLIGFESVYARPAWAAFALAIAWGIANRQYPAEEEAEL
jgi:hypothetical protein